MQVFRVLSKALHSKVIGQYFLKDIFFPWTHFQSVVQNHKDYKTGFKVEDLNLSYHNYSLKINTKQMRDGNAELDRHMLK